MSGWIPSMSLAGSSVSMTDAERDRGRQRLLDDDPRHRPLGAEGQDLAPERLGRAVVAELDEAVLDADQAAAVEDLVEVDGRRGVAADDDDRQLGRVAVRSP